MGVKHLLINYLCHLSKRLWHYVKGGYIQGLLLFTAFYERQGDELKATAGAVWLKLF